MPQSGCCSVFLHITLLGILLSMYLFTSVYCSSPGISSLSPTGAAAALRMLCFTVPWLWLAACGKMHQHLRRQRGSRCHHVATISSPAA